MKRVYIADSLADATLMCDWLVGCGVPCAVFNQNAVGGLGELPYSPPEVWIRRELDLDKAMRLIAEYHMPSVGGERQCGNCGERSPRGFELCWQCGALFPCDDGVG